MIARLLFVIFFVIVSCLFFTQNIPVAPDIANFDKAVHVLLFFLLAASMHYAFRLPWLWSMLLLTGYGIAIEIIQYRLPGRGADVLDVVADVVGAAAFYALFGLWKKSRRR